MICGGKITSSIGSLNSPNFPERYPTNITCEWILELPSEYTIEITFVYLNVLKIFYYSYNLLIYRTESKEILMRF